MKLSEELDLLAPWRNDIPSDWSTGRLDAAADVLFSNVDKHTKDDEIPVKLCNYVDVYKNDRITSEIDFMEATAEQREINTFQIKRGDILATKDSETPDDIAIPALVDEELDGTLCGYHLALIRPRLTSVSGPFLAWVHNSKQFRSQYEAKAVGVTRFGLSQYSFKAARIPIPPFPEQQRIVEFLDVSCQAIDAAVEAKRKQIGTLESLRKAIITRAITQGLKLDVPTKPSGHIWLGNIPKHWFAPCLKRLLSEPLTYGLNEAAELEDRELPRYLRITDFDEAGNLRDDTFRSLPWEIARNALLKPDDVLFARSGATVGKTFMYKDNDGDACFAGYLIRARTQHWKLNPDYLYLFTKSLAYEGWKSLIFTQATIQNISAAKYNYLAIPLPPLAEQQKIVNFIKDEEYKFSSLKNQIGNQIETLIAYRKSLIHECVTGKRRITEAELKKVKAHGKKQRQS